MQLNFKSKVNRNDKINFMTFILFLKFSFNLCNNKYKNFISLKLTNNMAWINLYGRAIILKLFMKVSPNNKSKKDHAQ